jgi:polysaccharide deacetylase family protein (PEP-CTERM system associated)
MPNEIFTVDVEEYYHADNILTSLPKKGIEKLPDRVSVGVEKLLNLLKKHDCTATFFILGCVAEKNRGLVKKIADGGHEIASHGYQHISLYKHTPKTFERDLKVSINILSEISGKKIIGYRAANFSFCDSIDWFFEILGENGILYDSSLCLSLFRKNSNKIFKAQGCGKINREILEFGTSFIKIGPLGIPLGGGYFRAYPYWLTKWGFEHVNRKRRTPPIFYIHPWELDPEQPRFKLPFFKSRHYIDLENTEAKLEKLLREIKFISIEKFIKSSNPP